jgi:DNA polymerase-3 subunit alpha
VLGPDVNESRETFTPVVAKVSGSEFQVPSSETRNSQLETRDGIPATSDARMLIRFGLAGIKGVGELAAQKIIEERDKNGPFRDFEEFLSRMDGRAINKRVLEHLTKTGAFDFSGASRKRLFDGIDAAMTAVAAQARDKAAGQHSFFDMFAEPAPAARTPAPGSPSSASSSDDVDDFATAEKLAYEKELLGFYVSGHPLNTFAGLTEAIDSYPITELLNQSDRTEFRLCGIAGSIAKRLSKKDNRPWASFVLATKNGTLPLNMFADAFENYGSILQENALVLVQGNVIVNHEGARINVKEAYPLENQIAGLVRKVVWLLHPKHRELPSFLKQLRATLDKQSGDTRTEVAFVFEDRISPYAELSTALTWKANGPAFQQLHAHPAVAGVQIETRRLELKQDRRWSKRS